MIKIGGALIGGLVISVASSMETVTTTYEGHDTQNLKIYLPDEYPTVNQGIIMVHGLVAWSDSTQTAKWAGYAEEMIGANGYICYYPERSLNYSNGIEDMEGIIDFAFNDTTYDYGIIKLGMIGASAGSLASLSFLENIAAGTDIECYIALYPVCYNTSPYYHYDRDNIESITDDILIQVGGNDTYKSHSDSLDGYLDAWENITHTYTIYPGVGHGFLFQGGAQADSALVEQVDFWDDYLQ